MVVYILYRYMFSFRDVESNGMAYLYIIEWMGVCNIWWWWWGALNCILGLGFFHLCISVI